MAEPAAVPLAERRSDTAGHWAAAAVTGQKLGASLSQVMQEPEASEFIRPETEPSSTSDDLKALPDDEFDAVIIGSGLGGLCCAAMLARYGRKVAIFEAHYAAGGVAHTFKRDGYTFDSGPSFHAGLSQRPSLNPLKHVLDAIDEEVECVQYDFWNCYFPEGLFVAHKEADKYKEEIKRFSPKAYEEFCKVEDELRPLFEAAVGLPTPALRWDPWVVPAVASQADPLALLKSGLVAGKIQGPYSNILDRHVTDKFLKGLLDLETNVLSGTLPAQTITAEMAVMHFERDKGTIDYPVNGGGAIVDALVRGLRKLGGKMYLRQHVDQVVIEDGRAVGVKLGKSGRVVRAKNVISNATVWDTFGKLVAPEAVPSDFRKAKVEAPMTESFMHLHLGIDATGLPDDLPMHHLSIESWERGVTAPQNLVIMSIPSVVDKKMAPPGKHAVHAYVAANEPYGLWEGMDRRSEEYKALKKERAEVLYRALENVIPDIRQRVELELIGTPLTHERFTRRYQGTYGAAYSAAESGFPGPKTPIPGLYQVGDSTAPGIGVPAVAASGMICANTIVPFSEHSALLQDMSKKKVFPQ